MGKRYRRLNRVFPKESVEWSSLRDSTFFTRMVEMSLFLDAATKWNSLQNTEYRIVLGHKKSTEHIKVTFRLEDFDHLSGMQYANDVDFGLHRNQYRGEKLVPALLSGKLDDKLIEKSQSWQKISERLAAVVCLDEILDSDFSIYKFDRCKLPFHSEIKAVYCIYSEMQKSGVFLFLDKENRCYYCKSVFEKDRNDYRTNQTRWTVLKKEKVTEEGSETLFVHRSYVEPVGV